MEAPSFVGTRPSVARRKSQVFVEIPSRPETPNTAPSTYISRSLTPRSHVYVEVPPLSRGASATGRRLSMNGQMHNGSVEDPAVSGSSTTSSLKENTPLRPSRTNSSSTSLSSLTSGNLHSVPAKDVSRKDRLIEPNAVASSSGAVTNGGTSTKRKFVADEEELDAGQAMSIAEKVKMKKPRLSRQNAVEVVVPLKAKKNSTAGKSEASKPAEKKAAQPVKENPDDALLYPNGWFYCHQCEKKRGNEIRLQCTMKDANMNDGRCKVKYCKPCLRNRYDQEFEQLKANDGSELSNPEKAKHISGETYYFECFKCRDVCNCKRCRKRHGLPPLGKLEAKKEKKPTTDGEQAPKPKKKATPKAKVDASKPTATPQEVPAVKRKARAKPAPKPKPIPKPTWTKLHVPLSLPDLEARIFIREFVHRFDGTLQVSMTAVEELEEMIGDSLGGNDEWDDGPELVEWVSEACVKSIVIGLLEVLSGRASVLGAEDLVKAIKETVKAVRASGANLNRIWTSLSALRSSARKCDAGLHKGLVRYPDPLLPPSTTTYRSTRSGGAAESGVNVACSAQMVPVVAFLVNQAIESPAIREAIDLGITDVKDITQGAKEAVTKENARYKEEKEGQKNKSKEDVKVARNAHMQTLQDIELGQKLALSAYAPRFSPLGRDADGRAYYAMTPSASECEAAEKLVTGKGSGKVKLRGHRGGFGEDERREMKRWGWFLCVHGEKPVDAGKAKTKNEEDESVESDLTDDEADVWWGFWDPAEIRKLAGWLNVKHRLDVEEEDQQTKNEPQAGPSVKTDAKPNVSSSSSKPKPVNGAATGSGRGRPSTTATSSARSSIKGKSREMSPLSDLSSSSDNDSSSALSDIDDSDVDMEDAFAQYSSPTAGKSELRALVKGLTEYTEMLQWRIGRVAPAEDAQAHNNHVVGDSKGKEKEKIKPVPASRFYAQ
ncbi:hypothetical protein EUX98_g2844 [Antrodiella citrinella]|uniref:Zinc-finger domain-containing protein n=1 Tax=Antrodiella citrinella TaxID=2447956 RepID=A0A4S4N0V7_9APHY|nr:hypothetical protein EUX98_g2844 [Antrodiella citrinella]